MGAHWSLAAVLLLACNGDKDGTDTTDTPAETGTPPGEEFTILGDASNLPAAGLLSIWGSSDSDVWIVGADDGSGPVVLHYDGSAWSRLDTGSTGDLWWVSSPGGDTIYMSGDGGRMLTYSRSAGTFTEAVIADPAYKLFGNWGTSDTDMYTVGGDIQNNLPGTILHNDGTGWTEVATAAPTGSGGQRGAFKVWGISASDVWVVGTGALVMHYDGSAWSDMIAPIAETSVITTVHGSGPSDVVMVGGPGNARVVGWDGSTLSDISPPFEDVAPQFNGVFAADQESVVACGASGSIFWREGTAWQVDPRPRPTSWDFHACWIDDKGAVWAVGGDLTSLTEGVVAYGGDAVPPIAL